MENKMHAKFLSYMENYPYSEDEVEAAAINSDDDAVAYAGLLVLSLDQRPHNEFFMRTR